VSYHVRSLDGDEVHVGTFDVEAEAFEAVEKHQAESDRIAWVTTQAGEKAEPDWLPVPITLLLTWIDYGTSMKWLVNGARQYVGHVSSFPDGKVLARYNPGFRDMDFVMNFEGGTQEQRIASAAAWLADKAKN
jgi:hypothetical protein